MIHVYRVRTLLRLLPIFLLVDVTALSGAIVCHAARMLLTAPKSLVAMDWLAIPGALGVGWVLFKLGSRFSQSPAKGECDEFLSTLGFGIFQAVGVKAWFFFTLVLLALVGGVAFGFNEKFDGHFHPQSYWDSALPSAQAQAPQNPQSHGTMYIAPSASPAPVAKPATSVHP